MPTVPPTDWSPLQEWWQVMGRRLQVEDRVEAFFRRALGVSQALAGVVHVGGEVEYILFVLVRYWIPVVLPPPGRERASKGARGSCPSWQVVHWSDMVVRANSVSR